MIVLLAIVGLSSCDALLDDEVTDYGTGPDFVGFTRSSVTAPFEVDGTTKTYNAVIDLFGPGSEFFTEDVIVTFEVDGANTSAEEGVQYDIQGGNTVTLSEANNYTASIPITVYTEGVEPPTEETLALTITNLESAATDPIIISENDDQLLIILSYICFADLSGTYTMTNSVCGAEVTDVTITANEDGGWYLSTADGGLLQYCTSNTGLQNDGVIIEVCGEIVPSDDVAFCGSNGIGCITGGTWDAEAGVLTLEHNDTFFGVGNYTSQYVRTSGGPADGGEETESGEDSEE